VRTVDFCVEGILQRELWGTLTVPDKTRGPVIVMAHGALGFKDWAFFPWLASFFAEAGYPVIRFNFSGSGMGPETDGPFEDLEAFQEDTITKQVEDLLSIIHCATHGKWEPDLPAQKKIYLWGHSRGGAVSLIAAARTVAVQGVATWATISRVNRYLYEVKQAWRKQGFQVFESSRTGQSLRYSTAFLDDVEKWGKEGDLPTYLHNLNVPVLLVHGSEDSSVSPDESESLAAIHPTSQLAILAGANHKFNADHPFTQPPAVLLEAAQRTLDFYQKLDQPG
jgi:pimeloyl-ACP methyl ester carboxylesterase